VWRSDNSEIALKSLRFSSEILYEDDAANAFTDGDILRINGGVETLHESLIHNFYPPADFLGLDALSGPVRNRVETPDPMITKIGGYGIGDINEGAVLTGGGTGAFPSGTAQIGLSDGTPALPYRPFGTFIPVDGILQADTAEFRVMYKNLTDPGAVAQPIRTQWTIDEWTGDIFDPCDPTGSWGNTGSADGWFDAAQYRNYRFTPGICPNTHLLLAVWDSKALPDVDENDHYIIWLEYRTTAGGATTFREANGSPCAVGQHSAQDCQSGTAHRGWQPRATLWWCRCWCYQIQRLRRNPRRILRPIRRQRQGRQSTQHRQLQQSLVSGGPD
jgi:hypothetical protein